MHLAIDQNGDRGVGLVTFDSGSLLTNVGFDNKFTARLSNACNKDGCIAFTSEDL